MVKTFKNKTSFPEPEFFSIYFSAQIKEIEKTSLSRLLCDNMKFDKVARDSFARPDV